MANVERLQHSMAPSQWNANFEGERRMDRIPITREGLEKLREELTRLERVERAANIRAIEEARGHGDLSENAEYHAAKERQSFIDGRINELRSIIGQSEIIEVDGTPSDTVVFGKTVRLYDIKSDEETSYQLLGPYESAPEAGRISVTSPLGQALVGMKVGDEVRVRTPRGVQEFEILEIL
jgi:transcription elongation factor GreA